MATLQEQLNQIGTDADKLHQILHGDAATDVPTDGGTVPTVRKLFSDISEREAANVAEAKVAAQSAAGAASDAVTAAEAAQTKAAAAEQAVSDLQTTLDIPTPAPGDAGRGLVADGAGGWALGGTAAGLNAGDAPGDVATNERVDAKIAAQATTVHPPQAIIKAPLGARPAGWGPQDCDTPVASMTASGTIVTVQAGLQVAYADSGRVHLSAELAAPLTVDLAAEADGTKHVYVNLNSDGTLASAGITSSAPQVGQELVDPEFPPSGVNVGSMSNLSRVFDGDVLKTAGECCAAGYTVFGSVGNDFGTPVLLSRATMYASSDSGFNSGSGGNTLKIVASDTNDAALATVIASVHRATDPAGGIETFDLSANTTPYRYWWSVVVPDGATDSKYVALVRWFVASESDIYNPSTIIMSDSSGAVLRRVYLGFAVISSGVVNDVVCYALGDIVVIPVNNGSNIASGSNVYQSDTPYIGRMSSIITEIYATPISAWAEGGFFTDSAAGRFTRTTQGNEILYTTTGVTSLLEKNSGYSGTRPIGQVVTSARARVVVKRGY